MTTRGVSEQTGREWSLHAEKGAVQGPRGRKELGRCEDLSDVCCLRTTHPQTVA